MDDAVFRDIVWQKGQELYRDMPWRHTRNPYAILVSEIMLQQTQVERVIPKYEAFMRNFPTIKQLAEASLADVLMQWNGLGYNRRAKYLHDAAQHICRDYNGVFSRSQRDLEALPGVGANTAGALCAYAYNIPVVFIETNIRTVYFYYYFQGQLTVSDKELREIVERTLDTEHPREWYWALMDYGAFLKRQGAGQLAKSRHYKKQPPLKGSVREVRGAILRCLARGPCSEASLRRSVDADDRFAVALEGLLKDGLIEWSGDNKTSSDKTKTKTKEHHQHQLQLPHKTV